MPHLIAVGFGVMFLLALGWFHHTVAGSPAHAPHLLERAHYARANLVVATMFQWSVGCALLGALVGSLIGFAMADVVHVIGSISAATLFASLMGTLIGLIRGLQA